jgi:hypothetical protein
MQISKKSKIFLKSNVSKVFPLFGYWEEKKWAYGWNPELIDHSNPDMKEGIIFKTKSSFDDEPYYAWIVSKYQPEKFLLEYTVSTENRIWVIKVKCIDKNDITEAIVSYTYTGLNDKGNSYNEKSLDDIFNENLKDWELAINHYLETGKTLIP